MQVSVLHNLYMAIKISWVQWTDSACVCVCVYLVDCTHACYGSYVISDGDQSGSGQVFLTDAVSLLFAHHVTKTIKETIKKPNM